jgi:3-oxoacyl-[acyl-carrier protein] reductase
LTDLRPLSGKVALVTGGTRGIGRAIVERLARDGAAVAFGYHSRSSAAAEVEAWASDAGVVAAGFQADLADPATPEQLVRATLERFGGLDILVANAAYWSSAPLVEMPVAEFERMYVTNVRATFLLIQEAARVMIAAGRGGRVVVLTSRAARRPRIGTSAYTTTKGALISLARSTAVELAQYGITSNEVAPGPTETEMNEDLRNDPAIREALLQFILLKRFGKPTDAAAAVAFLASDEASFITGTTIAVDGGGSVG